MRAQDLLGGAPMMPALNPDGISVRGSKYIYAPAGQAGEYAPLAANPYRGCGHGCAYCYVPRVTKQLRAEFDEGAVLRNDYFRQLEREAALYQRAGITEQVMLSFTSDPFHRGDLAPTRRTLEVIQEHGMAICTLTKGGTRALPFLHMFRRDRDAFASTLTSLDERFSLKWERNAAVPMDRLTALRTFHDAGIFTWVSLEPTLDVDASLEIVNVTAPFVDLYKVGRVNYLPMTRTTDWRDYTLRMIDRLHDLGKAHYIKLDLQGFLPPGYHNPLRVPQHH